MEEEQDIQSDIVKQKQLRDAQENQEFDRDMDAYRRGKDLTDEQRKQVLQDNARKRQLLGSQLLDDIGDKFTEFGSSVMEASQEDPDTWTDDAIRIGLGGVKNVGTVLGAPGIKQGLQLLGAPAYYVGRGLGYGLEKAGVDPRYGHIVGEVGEWFIPGYGMYKAAGKIVKGANTLDIARMLEKTAQPAYAKSISPVSDALNPERLARIKTLKTNLLRKIDDGYIEEIVEQGDNVIYPPGSKEADILANTRAMASDAYETDLTKFYAGENVQFPVRVIDEVPQDIRGVMAYDSGLVDNIFDFERWLGQSLYGKRYRSRDTVAKMQAPHGTDVNFESYRDNILLQEFRKEWGPILDKLKIKRSSLQAHHIFAIRASAGLYDGLKFGSKEWVDVTNTLLEKYVRTGDMPKNLMPLVGSTSDIGTPHYITHRYIDDIIGPTGETFFTKEVRDKMKRNHKYRINVTKDFAEKMKTAEGVAVQAQKVWDEIYGPGQVIPEKLVEMFSELPMQVNPKYRTDVRLEQLVRQVFSQINEFPFPESMSRKEFVRNWLPQFEGKGFDALRRMFEVDLDLTPEEAMQTPLGYRLQKYLQDRVVKNPIKKKFVKRKKK